MPELLSEEWFEALDAVLAGLSGGPGEADGPGLALGQIVTGVPEGAGVARSPDGQVRYTMVLRHDGTALLARDTVEMADVVLVEDWGTARAIASGESVSDLLTAGRIKVRGDSRALVAGGEVLARVAPLVGAALGGGGRGGGGPGRRRCPAAAAAAPTPPPAGATRSTTTTGRR